MHATPFPHLPPDIERLILECSAYHDRSMALSLVRVSQRIQSWIDPILYRHVVLSCPSQAQAFLRTLTGKVSERWPWTSKSTSESAVRKPRGFFENQVKILCFAYGVDIRDAVEILRLCGRAVVGLASWIEPYHLGELPDPDLVEQWRRDVDIKAFSTLLTTGPIRLRRLSMILHHFLCASPTPLPSASALNPVPGDPDFTLPLLTNLTHLDIYQGAEHFASWSWRGFASLSHLTHLSFDVGVCLGVGASANALTLEDTVCAVLAHVPPNLRICLVLLSSRGFESMVAGVGGLGGVGHDVGRFWAENEAVGRMARGEVDRRVVVGTNEDFWDFLNVGGGEGEGGSEDVCNGRDIGENGLTGLVVVHLYDALVRDWGFVTCVSGEEDMWEKAERILDRRQRKTSRSVEC